MMSEGVGVERSLVLIKPDGVGRSLVGEILSRFERKGLSFVGMKLMQLTEERASKHYAEHEGKPFYEGLLKFITSSPLVAVAVEGRGAIATVRKLVGATSGQKADPGTIRGDFAVSDSNNLVHASDSAESAARELKIFFEDAELCTASERLWILNENGG